LAPLRRSTLRPPGNCRARRRTPAHKFRARRRRYPPLPRLLSARLRLLPPRGHRVLPICSAVHRSTGVDVASGRSPTRPNPSAESVPYLIRPPASASWRPETSRPKVWRTSDSRHQVPLTGCGAAGGDVANDVPWLRAALPLVTLVAIGIRIARAKVLAICIRAELRAIAGIGDKCTGCEGRPDNGGGSNQSGEQDRNAPVSCANGFLAGSFNRDNPASELDRRRERAVSA
jgi:hypothetical protein